MTQRANVLNSLHADGVTFHIPSGSGWLSATVYARGSDVYMAPKTGHDAFLLCSLTKAGRVAVRGRNVEAPSRAGDASVNTQDRRYMALRALCALLNGETPPEGLRVETLSKDVRCVRCGRPLNMGNSIERTPEGSMGADCARKAGYKVAERHGRYAARARAGMAAMDALLARARKNK